MFESTAGHTPTHSLLGLPRTLPAHLEPQRLANAVSSPAEAYESRLLGQIAHRRDETAFEELYRRHSDAVLRTAMQICRDKSAAEDIAQHAFGALWLRAQRLATKSVRLRPWLTTVARNAAIDYVRSNSAATISVDDVQEQASSQRGPELEFLAGETSNELHVALGALSPKQRQAIEFVYLAGLTYQAAAEITGEPLGTIKSRVRLALGHLRTRLSG